MGNRIRNNDTPHDIGKILLTYQRKHERAAVREQELAKTREGRLQILNRHWNVHPPLTLESARELVLLALTDREIANKSAGCSDVVNELLRDCDKYFPDLLPRVWSAFVMTKISRQIREDIEHNGLAPDPSLQVKVKTENRNGTYKGLTSPTTATPTRTPTAAV
jgi:hypothetical protein